MLCSLGCPLTLYRWLAVPFLFAAAVLSLIGTAGLLTGSFGGVPLSTPIFGAATAVAAAVSGAVHWTASWQRHWLRWPYLTAVLAGGVVIGGVELPVLVAAVVGMPTAMVLVTQCFLDRRRSDADASRDCPS